MSARVLVNPFQCNCKLTGGIINLKLPTPDSIHIYFLNSRVTSFLSIDVPLMKQLKHCCVSSIKLACVTVQFARTLSIFQGKALPPICGHLTPCILILKMEALYSSETSTKFYHNTWRNIAKDSTLQCYCRDNLKLQ